MFTLQCRGKLLTTQRPLVMGILNITPDSFYEGHLAKDLTTLTDMAGEQLAAGADILDIGGQSTRSGSIRISAEEEAGRVLPVIRSILEKFPETVISVDTYHSSVAVAAVQAGAAMVNDISAGRMDPEMIPAVASLQVPYIIMHMKGVPETMQQEAQYEDVTTEVLDFFIERTALCRQAGIRQLIIDPGFGFGKTIEHNFRLLSQLSVFSILQLPVLAGISRKSTIYRTLNITAAEALNGTTCLHTIALLNGASLLRVHDVRAAKEAVQLVEAYQQQSVAY